MVILTRITYHDDKDASMSLDIMPCLNVENAMNTLVETLCDEFCIACKGIDDVASILADDLYSVSWDDENKVFEWMDNGQGETFIIGYFDPLTYNEFQNIL